MIVPTRLHSWTPSGIRVNQISVCSTHTQQTLEYAFGLLFGNVAAVVTSVTRLGDLLDLATINLPKSPTYLGNFCKGVKIFPFSSEIILGNFYRHLTTLYWSHWWWLLRGSSSWFEMSASIIILESVDLWTWCKAAKCSKSRESSGTLGWALKQPFSEAKNNLLLYGKDTML